MEPEKKSSGAVVGLVVIIIILILGGFYIWKSNQVEDAGEGADVVTPADSSELDSLEQDLEDVDLNIDASVINSVE